MPAFRGKQRDGESSPSSDFASSYLPGANVVKMRDVSSGAMPPHSDPKPDRSVGLAGRHCRLARQCRTERGWASRPCHLARYGIRAPPVRHRSPPVSYSSNGPLLASLPGVTAVRFATFASAVVPVVLGLLLAGSYYIGEPDKPAQVEGISDARFNETVLCGSKPVLVDFCAAWCGPCRRLAPILEEVSRETDAVRFVKIDVDQHRELAASSTLPASPA